MSDNINTETIKMCIVGEPTVGKTSIMFRLAKGKFENDYGRTKLSDMMKFQAKHRGKNYNINAWDTPGDTRCREQNRLYYRNADAVVLTYDVGNASSFEQVKAYWIDDVKKKAPEAIFFLVGNKSDLPDETWEVATEDGHSAAESNSLTFLEVSAKQGTNMNKLVKTICDKLLEQGINQRPSTLDLSLDNTAQENSSCC